MVINDDGVHLTYHQSRAELGPMPSWVVWMVTGESLGSGRRSGEGLAPVLMFLRMLNQGLKGWWWPNNTLPLRNVGYRLRARLSWIRSFSKSAQR